jgi:hypothetical protein
MTQAVSVAAAKRKIGRPAHYGKPLAKFFPDALCSATSRRARDNFFYRVTALQVLHNASNPAWCPFLIGRLQDSNPPVAAKNRHTNTADDVPITLAHAIVDRICGFINGRKTTHEEIDQALERVPQILKIMVARR